MSYKNRVNNQKKSAGFTIIEVLIVLAIAGLILLIVFLAVPALQRNSRNTTAKNDAQNVLGGVSEFQGANNGKIPTGASGTGDITFAGTTPTKISIQGTTSVKTVAADSTYSATASTTTGDTINTGIIGIYPGRICAPGAVTTTANSRSVAIFYTIETASATPIVQCISA